MTDDERLTELKRKLTVSESVGLGYKDRIAEIKRQIAEIEARDAQPN